MGTRLTRVAAWMGATTLTCGALVVISLGLDHSGAATGPRRGCRISHPSSSPDEPGT